MLKHIQILCRRWRRARTRRLALQELSKFSDRELQDLGIGRSEIYARVYGID